MRIRTLAVLLILPFLLNGCLYSLYPITEDKDCVFDQRLLGMWMSEDGTPSISFEQLSRNSYLATIYQTGLISIKAEVHYTVIEGQGFLMFGPGQKKIHIPRKKKWLDLDFSEMDLYQQIFQIPAYFIWPVKLENNEILRGDLTESYNFEKTYARLNEIIGDLPHADYPFKGITDAKFILLMAKPPELRRFYLKLASKLIWNDPKNTLYRLGKVPAPTPTPTP